MATWTIISGTGTGTQLVGCKIVKTVRNGVVTYQFVGKGVNEGNPTINTTAPNLTNVPYNQNTWNISSATPPADLERVVPKLNELDRRPRDVDGPVGRRRR